MIRFSSGVSEHETPKEMTAAELMQTWRDVMQGTSPYTLEEAQNVLFGSAWQEKISSEFWRWRKIYIHDNPLFNAEVLVQNLNLLEEKFGLHWPEHIDGELTREMTLHLGRMLEQNKRSINRALSKKISCRTVDLDPIVFTYPGLAKLARLLFIFAYSDSLLELLSFFTRLFIQKFVTTWQNIFILGPPLKPIQLIPQAKPNAPGFSA